MTEKKSVDTISAADAQLVGCPLPASVVARTESIRKRAAFSCNSWRREALELSKFVDICCGSCKTVAIVGPLPLEPSDQRAAANPTLNTSLRGQPVSYSLFFGCDTGPIHPYLEP